MIPTRLCMNLAATVNVVLYDRLAKQLMRDKPTA
jgi:tRNA(Leu) C34 or U34 (ribose-2'-O)-methylase TrmL